MNKSLTFIKNHVSSSESGGEVEVSSVFFFRRSIESELVGSFSSKHGTSFDIDFSDSAYIILEHVLIHDSDFELQIPCVLDWDSDGFIPVNGFVNFAGHSFSFESLLPASLDDLNHDVVFHTADEFLALSEDA